MRYEVARPAVLTALALVLGLLVPACAGKKMTKANYDQIKEGMTVAEVQKILGEPDDTTGGDVNLPSANAAGLDLSGPPTSGGKTMKWQSGKKLIEVYFDKQGKVTGKKSDNL